jgi:hypothetical protein
MTPGRRAEANPRSGTMPGRGFLLVFGVWAAGCGPTPAPRIMSADLTVELLALAVERARDGAGGPAPGAVWFDAEGALAAMASTVASDASPAIMDGLRAALPGVMAGSFDHEVDCLNSLECEPTADWFFEVRGFEVEDDGRVRVVVGMQQVVGTRRSGFGVPLWFERVPPGTSETGGEWRFLSRGIYVVS